jgi:arylesterase/paraoxonase
MSSFWRGIIVAFGVLVVAVGILGWRFLAASGYFTAIRQEVVAECRAIASPPGPEDIQIDRAHGLAFVSAFDRRAAWASGPQAKGLRGGIYVLDLNAPQAQWALHPVTASEPAEFHPRGLSLYVAPDGTRRLFVVNNSAGQGETVEIFDIGADAMLTHMKTVSDPLLVSLNDVVAVGPEAFYATNDHTTSNPTRKLISDLLLLRNGNIVYYDGAAVRIAGDTLVNPSGIAVSADGKSIYVTDQLDASLHVYGRDPATGDITGRDFVRLGTGLDKIDVEEDGALLVAAHPQVPGGRAHMIDPGKPWPSQVVRVEFAREGGGKAGTIYLNRGEEVSGSSVAAGYGDLMLIGNAFDPKIMICKQSKEMKSF